MSVASFSFHEPPIISWNHPQSVHPQGHINQVSKALGTKWQTRQDTVDRKWVWQKFCVYNISWIPCYFYWWFQICKTTLIRRIVFNFQAKQMATWWVIACQYFHLSRGGKLDTWQSTWLVLTTWHLWKPFPKAILRHKFISMRRTRESHEMSLNVIGWTMFSVTGVATWRPLSKRKSVLKPWLEAAPSDGAVYFPRLHIGFWTLH